LVAMLIETMALAKKFPTALLNAFANPNTREKAARRVCFILDQFHLNFFFYFDCCSLKPNLKYLIYKIVV
jgi:hypothetical protein